MSQNSPPAHGSTGTDAANGEDQSTWDAKGFYNKLAPTKKPKTRIIEEFVRLGAATMSQNSPPAHGSTGTDTANGEDQSTWDAKGFYNKLAPTKKPKTCPCLLALCCVLSAPPDCSALVSTDLFIERFCMTGGRSLIGYLKAYHTNLYLSSDSGKVGEALGEGIAAATIFSPDKVVEVSDTQLRVAFDGDAVLFSDESEQIVKAHGLDRFFEHEKEHENSPLAHVGHAWYHKRRGGAVLLNASPMGVFSCVLTQNDSLSTAIGSKNAERFHSGPYLSLSLSLSLALSLSLSQGPLKGFLEALGKLQKKFYSKGQRLECPIRTYLVTARSAASSGARALKTLRSWGLETDEALFLAGAPKGPLLEKIRPHIFFDDQMFHVEGATEMGTVSAHVPYGVAQRYKKSATKKEPAGGK
ncbi:UNVERIFIED_CONTAM: hypothetical protein FKN15_053645 [Acipenser sinensis]